MAFDICGKAGACLGHVPRNDVFDRLLGLMILICFSVWGGCEATAANFSDPPVKRRFLVNNDGTNLLWRDDLTPEMIRKHVAECPNAVTTYLVCPNGIQKMLYPSKHEELSTRGRLKQLVAEGHDPFGEFLEGLRRRGFEVFITWRMNEVHNVDNPNEADLSRFWREHPQYRVEKGANPNDWMAQCLDYSVEPVREYALRLIFEAMEKYAPDGIELDWMRFPRHLSGSGESVWAKRHCLTDVVARVKQKSEELARSRGRRFLVAVRVPTSRSGCRALGVDIAEWNRRGLIDFVTASPFLATDFVMPLEELRAELGERKIPLYAAIEFGYAGKPHREETIRGAAMGLWDSGANGIYLFNFPCWREQQPKPPWSWVSALGDPMRLRGRDLTFALVNKQHRVSGIDLPVQLPLTIAPGKTESLPIVLPNAAFASDNMPFSGLLTLTSSGTTKLNCCLNNVPVEPGKRFSPTNLHGGNNLLTLLNTNTTSTTLTLAELTLEYDPAPMLKLAATGPVFHVATNGSDHNPGSDSKPFLTLRRAVEAGREARRDQGLAQKQITVLLHRGSHYLNEPLVLDARDEGTVFRASPGENPVISGGVVVRGWRPDAGGRWKTCVDLHEFRHLYVNGKRAVRARADCSRDILRYGDLEYIDSVAGFVFPDGAMAEWRNHRDIELGFFSSWSHMICPVERVLRDGAHRAIVLMRQPTFFLACKKEGAQAVLPAYIQNALELLDSPREWYYDSHARTLYYIPSEEENMSEALVVAPQLESLVRLEGTPDRPVRSIVFEGITFAEATWCGPSRAGHLDVQANFTIDDKHIFARDGCVAKQHNEYIKSPANVVLRSAVDCRFEACTFTRLGGAGLDLEHGSCGNIVNRCEFFDVSGTAIQIGDVQAEDHHPRDQRLIVRDNRITNSRIHHVGAEFEGSVGIFVGYTESTLIACNEIHDLPYSGISVGWGWGEEDAGGGAYEIIPFRYGTPTTASGNRIERNHIYRTMQRRDDGGAIYTLGNQPGTMICDNHIHDCGPGGPGGIYLDEGSGFIEITRNTVYHVAKPINYNNLAQDRVTTCFEHDNCFGAAPNDPEFRGRPAELQPKASHSP